MWGIDATMFKYIKYIHIYVYVYIRSHHSLPRIASWNDKLDTAIDNSPAFENLGQLFVT